MDSASFISKRSFDPIGVQQVDDFDSSDEEKLDQSEEPKNAIMEENSS